MIAILFGVFVLPVVSLAEEAKTEKVPLKFIPQVSIPGTAFIANKVIQIDGDTIANYIAAVYQFLVGLAGLLALGAIAVNAYTWLTSVGNPQALSQAKKRIAQALIGLFIALFSFVLLQLLNPSLITLPNFTPGAILRKEQEFAGRSEKGVPAFGGCSTKAVTLPPNVTTTQDATFRAAAGGNTDRCLQIKAIAYVESGWGRALQSPVGALGWMQIIPSTGDRVCSLTPDELRNDPVKNINCGAKYFSRLISGTETGLSYCQQNKSSLGVLSVPNSGNPLRYAAAGYNGGAGANCRSNSCSGQTYWECTANPGYAETRCYADKVEEVYKQLKAKSNNGCS